MVNKPLILQFLLAGMLSILSGIALGADIVQCRHLVSDLVQYKAPWFEVVVPTSKGFEYHRVENEQEVKTLMRASDPDMVSHMDILFEKAHREYQTIIASLRPVAEKFGAKFESRVKDADSSKGKIISRARSFHEDGEIYTPSKLYDLVGTRLIVPLDSHLVRMGSAHEGWARFLNVKPEQVLEVEVKGTTDDCRAGSCYRATHIALLHDSGVQWEIQVITQTMSDWAKWDHPTVYKRSDVTPEYKKSLKAYSQGWVTMIRALENRKLYNDKSTRQIQRLLSDHGIEVDITKRGWLKKYDLRLAEKYGINSEDHFIPYHGPAASAALKELSILD